MTEPPDRVDPPQTSAVSSAFQKSAVWSFIFMVLFSAVILRLWVGVKQRLEREKNIIDIDPDPPTR